MLLRSSSTPVLGSLLSSFSESPIHHSDPHTTTTKPPPTATTHHHNNKLSFSHQTSSLNFTTFSCNSSPISPAISDFSEPSHSKGFPRAQSDGNLQGLVNASCNNYDEFNHKKNSRRQKSPLLQTIPSFSFHNSKSRFEDEDSDDDEHDEELKGCGINGELFEKSYSVREKNMMAIKNGGSCLNNKYKQGCFEEVEIEMYIAAGLGVSVGSGGFGGSGGGDLIPVAFGRDGGDRNALEEHYKRMVEENPGNPLCLRNYGHFLYEVKQDLEGAEEYYSRAILADPIDGEVLSQYAKVVWELHHDQGRASSYFRRAIQAAPEDSHVQASYASFLWETEEDGDEDSSQNDHPRLMPRPRRPFHMEAMTSQTA